MGLALVFHMDYALAMGRRSALVAVEILAELGRQRVTLEQLSDRSGIEVSDLERRLHGNEVFDVEQLDSVARALQVPVGALMGTG